MKWVGMNWIPEDVGLEHCFGVNWVGINWMGMPWDWVLEGTDARLVPLDFWSMFEADLVFFFKYWKILQNERKKKLGLGWLLNQIPM